MLDGSKKTLVVVEGTERVVEGMSVRDGEVARIATITDSEGIEPGRDRVEVGRKKCQKRGAVAGSEICPVRG